MSDRRTPLDPIPAKITLSEVMIATLALLFSTMLLVVAANHVNSESKRTATFENLKLIGVAGALYAVDHDDKIHPYQQHGTNYGYFLFLEPYSIKKENMYDMVRGIDPTVRTSKFEWTQFVSLSVNRNGWVGFEGPPPEYAPRRPRTLSAQEDIAKRAAYVISSNYDSPQSHAFSGYGFITEESACAVSEAARRVENKRFNRVYLATKYHNGNIVVSFGDTHAGQVSFRKVGKINESEDEAQDCSAYGNNNNSGVQSQIDLAFWGTWYEPTK